MVSFTYAYPTPSAPTAGEIADALAGRNGPVNLRYRYQQRDHDYQFQADLTDAVYSCEIEMDNDRPVKRSAEFEIDAAALPVAFDPDTDHIAVIAILEVPTYQNDGRWVIQEVELHMGLFHLDVPRRRYEEGGHIFWDVSASDVTVHLLTAKFITPYTVASGTAYMDAVETILGLVGLHFHPGAATDVTPVSYTWAPGTTYWQAVHDLLYGINYYDVWADGEGHFHTAERIDPSTETAVVTYSTEAEPRMVVGPFETESDHTRWANRIVVVIDDPRRTPEYALRVNNDPDSPISIVTLSADGGGFAVVNSDPEISGGKVVDIETAQEIADFELKDRACRAAPATLRTFADPRRAPNESYAITVEDAYTSALFRANAWRLRLEPGAVMDHQIDRASAITTSIVITLSGTILVADAASIVAGGDTIILTMPTNYEWVAAGATFNAVRQDIIDGLVSSGSAANGWNNEVVPAIAVTDVVRTSATIVTITLPAVAGYAITVPEEITCTVPTAAVLNAQDNYTEPTFTVIP